EALGARAAEVLAIEREAELLLEQELEGGAEAAELREAHLIGHRADAEVLAVVVEAGERAGPAFRELALDAQRCRVDVRACQARIAAVGVDVAGCGWLVIAAQGFAQRVLRRQLFLDRETRIDDSFAR